MQVSSKVEVPDNVEFTVSVTATVREWRLMLKDMGASHPTWILKDQIRDAIARVENESLGPFMEVTGE